MNRAHTDFVDRDKKPDAKEETPKKPAVGPDTLILFLKGWPQTLNTNDDKMMRGLPQHRLTVLLSSKVARPSAALQSDVLDAVCEVTGNKLGVDESTRSKGIGLVCERRPGVQWLAIECGIWEPNNDPFPGRFTSAVLGRLKQMSALGKVVAYAVSGEPVKGVDQVFTVYGYRPGISFEVAAVATAQAAE